MHHFRTAALIEDNGKATNSPNYRYRLTDEFLKVIQETKKTNEDNAKTMRKKRGNSDKKASNPNCRNSLLSHL